MYERCPDMLLQFREGLTRHCLDHGEQFRQETLQSYAGQDIGFHDSYTPLLRMCRMHHLEIII